MLTRTPLRILAAVALVAASIGFGGATTAYAEANPNANCAGRIASHGNSADGQGAGGHALAEIAQQYGGLGQFIRGGC
jgi:hypothetical protein